jgi:hypothetical protein
MKNDDTIRSLQWRRFIVDMLIGASTIALALALIDALTGASYTSLLLGAAVLVGAGLLIEPGDTMQPDGVQAQVGSQERFDAPIIEAASA